MVHSTGTGKKHHQVHFEIHKDGLRRFSIVEKQKKIKRTKIWGIRGLKELNKLFLF